MRLPTTTVVFDLFHTLTGLESEWSELPFTYQGGSNELIAAREIGMGTVFVSGALAELWPEKVAERIGTADHHIARIPEIMSLLGLESRADEDPGVQASR